MNRDNLKKGIKKLLKFLPDKIYVKLYFRMNLGYKLNDKEPSTFNEKMQWLKFNNRNSLQTVVSDKVSVRNYVENTIGENYLIPLVGAWENFSSICFERLPNEFVLKCNHDSGGLCICHNKKTFDIKKAEKTINRALKSNFFYIGREYQYKFIKKKILCEKMLKQPGKVVPDDFKIYCFNGKADCVMICTDRFLNNSHKARYRFFDKNWNFLKYMKNDDNVINDIEKPKNLELMFELAEKLSKPFIFARIDFYNIDGHLYLGEITLCPNAGFDPDLTFEADLMFGNKLNIPYWDKIEHSIW